MGRISTATRDGLAAAVTGLRRKRAMRLLRGGQPSQRSGPRPGRRVYDDAAREALVVIWEASDRICGERLRPLVPTLVEAWNGTATCGSRRRPARACWR